MDPINSETPSITGTNFERKVLNSNTTWVLQLFVDNSPDCRRLAPVWELVSRQLDGIAQFGRIDISVQHKLALTMAEHPLFGTQVFPL